MITIDIWLLIALGLATLFLGTMFGIWIIHSFYVQNQHLNNDRF